MSKNKPPPQAVFVPASRLVWDDERLRALDKKQLANLLVNLQTQLAVGRISDETASDLEKRIRSRLPRPARSTGRKRRSKAPHEDAAEEGNKAEAEK